MRSYMSVIAATLAVVMLLAHLPSQAHGQVSVAVTLKETLFEKILTYETEVINKIIQSVVIPGDNIDVGLGVHVWFDSFTLSSVNIGGFGVVPLSDQALQVSINDLSLSVNAGCGAGWFPQICLPLIGCFCFPFCVSCGGSCQAQASQLTLSLTVTIVLQGDTFQVMNPKVTSMFQQLNFAYNPEGFFCRIADDIMSIFFNLNSAVSGAIQGAFENVNSVGGAIQSTLNSYLGQLHGMCAIKTYNQNYLTLYMASSEQGCSITYAPDMSLFDIAARDFSVVLQVGQYLNQNGTLFGCVGNAQCCQLPPAEPSCLTVTGAYAVLTNCNFCAAIQWGVWYLGGSSDISFVPQ